MGRGRPKGFIQTEHRMIDRSIDRLTDRPTDRSIPWTPTCCGIDGARKAPAPAAMLRSRAAVQRILLLMCGARSVQVLLMHDRSKPSSSSVLNPRLPAASFLVVGRPPVCVLGSWVLGSEGGQHAGQRRIHKAARSLQRPDARRAFAFDDRSPSRERRARAE